MSFKLVRGKVSDQGRGLVVYTTMELDLHVDIIVCSSNYIVIHFIGKEFGVAPYTDVYKTIKAVQIV